MTTARKQLISLADTPYCAQSSALAWTALMNHEST